MGYVQACSMVSFQTNIGKASASLLLLFEYFIKDPFLHHNSGKLMSYYLNLLRNLKHCTIKERLNVFTSAGSVCMGWSIYLQRLLELGQMAIDLNGQWSGQ